MPSKKLKDTNPYMRDAKAARRRRVRSIASSTAIETGESIKVLEEMLRRRHSRLHRVTLA